MNGIFKKHILEAFIPRLFPASRGVNYYLKPPAALHWPQIILTFFAELLENVKVIRGVEAVGLVNCVPLSRSLHWLLQIVSCRFPVSVAIAQEWRDNPAPLRNW
jgi:hypothetical protein